MISKYVKHSQSFASCGRSLVDCLCRDKNGGAAIMFGLMATVMVLFVAAAVDYSRWSNARATTKSAVDAAVLAGARSLQVDNSNTNAALAAAQRYYKQNTANLNVVDDNIRFSAAHGNMAMQAVGQSYIQTPFLNLIGISRLALMSDVNGVVSEAVVATGGKGLGEVELSIMLDITGSMSGTKLKDLKAASKDLIDIVLLEENGKSRIALVPFSEAINIDKNWAAEVVSNGPQWIDVNRYNYTNRYYLDPLCATERTGSEAFTDAAPNGQNKLGRFYSASGRCMPKSGSVIPLSQDKSMLKNAIDGYQASGNTAGHLGTAWAWYMLSPNWAQRVPPASRPGLYGQEGLRKIAILMTDGEYNQQYKDGYSGSSPNGSSAIQARQLCTNMKAAGITVYTVGFQLPKNGASVTTLQKCATDDSHFYNANDGDALRQAFRDIALQISTLYLTR